VKLPKRIPGRKWRPGPSPEVCLKRILICRKLTMVGVMDSKQINWHEGLHEKIISRMGIDFLSRKGYYGKS
jgi:hypothetical protein